MSKGTLSILTALKTLQCVGECRVATAFSQPSLVVAHRLLLRAALKETANSLFVTLSETCIPIYHPALFWAQLVSESHSSRMSDAMFNRQRWAQQMATAHLEPGHFRKGSQFNSLTRMHAQYAAFDKHVWTQFESFCKTQVCATVLIAGVYVCRCCCSPWSVACNGHRTPAL